MVPANSTLKMYDIIRDENIVSSHIGTGHATLG